MVATYIVPAVFVISYSRTIFCYLKKETLLNYEGFCGVFYRLTFVGSAGSFGFSSPPQRPMTSDFEGFQYQILSITLFSYLNS